MFVGSHKLHPLHATLLESDLPHISQNSFTSSRISGLMQVFSELIVIPNITTAMTPDTPV
jgi:hypothetical protein